MESRTWGRSVPLSERRERYGASEPQSVDWVDDDVELERWHESHLGNFCYLAIFAAVAVVTAIAFVPVWLALQVQRALEALGLSRPNSGRD